MRGEEDMMPSPTPNRRDVLKRATTLAAASSLAGLAGRVMLYKSPRITIIIAEGQFVAHAGADVAGNPDHGYKEDAAKTAAKKVAEKGSEPVLPELDALNEQIWFS
jgi:hypothetical protein